MPVASRDHQKEQIYSTEDINIPVALPCILKCYVKAAIRTQPYDLLSWTAAYFRALANGELPPVKERLEYPPYEHASGITPRFLKILLNQYCHDEERLKVAKTEEKLSRTMNVKFESLLKRWRGMALKDKTLYQILMTGRLVEQTGSLVICDLYRFLAVACGLLGKNLLETMIYICELMTDEPDGGSAMISFRIFMNLYEYLATLDCSGGQSIIPPGSTTVQTIPEKDGATVGQSSHFTFSSSKVSSASLKTDVSSITTGSRALHCQSSDNSFEDTLTEDSSCFLEVASNQDGSGNSESMEEANVDGTGSSEKEIKRKVCGCIDLPNKKKTRVKDGTEQRMKRPREISTSNNTTYDVEMHLELEVAECDDEKRVDGSGTEVTKVQEERRRSWEDVEEMHSKTEKVRPTLDDGVDDDHHDYEDEEEEEEDENATKTVPQLRQSLVSSASPSHDGTSSSSLAKSHVSVVKDVENSQMATWREETMSQEFDQTGEMLETKSSQIEMREVGGADVLKIDDFSLVSEDRVTNISGERWDENMADNDEMEDRTSQKGFLEKKIGSIGSRRRSSLMEEKKAISEDAFENEDESMSEKDDDLTTLKKINSRRKDDEKRGSRLKSFEERHKNKKSKDIISNSEDYVDFESFDEHEGFEEEEFKDMEKYESIGLENVLQGLCECLETTKDEKRKLESPSISKQPKELSPETEPLDIVADFFEKMKNEECPTGFYILPEVPGIGSPVSPETITAVGLWLTECSRRQQGQIGPRNLRHFMCPDLDGKSHEDDYYEKTCSTKEENLSFNEDVKKRFINPRN